MRSFFLFIIVISLNLSYSQTGWYLLNSGVTVTLNSLYFINSNTGFAAGTNIILKTTDSGLNWTTVYSGTGGYNIQFISDFTGFSIGAAGLIKTTNWGINWTLYPSNIFYGNFHFADSLIGYSCSLYSFSKTFDGGMTWYPLVTGIPYYSFYSTYFINTMTGYIAGGRVEKPNGSYYMIAKTTNGGASWPNIIYGSGFQLSKIYFLNSSIGYALGGQYIMQTINSGGSWSVTSTSIQNYLYSVNFPGIDTGFVAGSHQGAGGGGRIWRTINGGANWHLLYSYQRSLRSVFFINNFTGFVCGDFGTILKTNDGGVTGLVPVGNVMPKEYKLYQNYPNPFNPVTKIRFQMPVGAQYIEPLQLKIYDILGREVATLVNEELKPGTYEVEWDGTNYPSGVYYYKLTVGDYTDAKKMILIK